jgi:hypothetical protein
MARVKPVKVFSAGFFAAFGLEKIERSNFFYKTSCLKSTKLVMFLVSLLVKKAKRAA